MNLQLWTVYVHPHTSTPCKCNKSAIAAQTQTRNTAAGPMYVLCFAGAALLFVSRDRLSRLQPRSSLIPSRQPLLTFSLSNVTQEVSAGQYHGEQGRAQASAYQASSERSSPTCVNTAMTQ